ncbi:MAG TPA: VOC family protein [Pseudonocardiaceae bacterium]
MTTITPYLLYEDAAAAITWLGRAYGFTETLRYTTPEGRVSHAELAVGDGTVMLGEPGGDYRSPRVTGHVHSFLHVTVDDVDAHCEAARAAGATILSEPQDTSYGLRGYRSVDLEGHRWDFATVLREVAPEEWGATSAGAR